MNKRGFFAVSIIFSFFIVFLLILVMNLTAYSQNRILLGQVKKDIKSSIKLELPSKKCKRDSSYSGSLEMGDKFICDVNGDGNFDSTNEVFYYISSRYNANSNNLDENEDSENYIAVLIHNKTTNTVVPYSNSDLTDAFISALPKVDEWKNVRLYETTRDVTDETGTVRRQITYSYNNKDCAARLATFQEIENFLKEKCDYDGPQDNESTKITSCSAYQTIIGNPDGYWLENYTVQPLRRWVIAGGFRAYQFGWNAYVRPVIEVNKNQLEI